MVDLCLAVRVCFAFTDKSAVAVMSHKMVMF